MSEVGDYTNVTSDERAALTALCTEYCWRADNYCAERIPELFVEDGTWEGTGTFMNGHEELVAGWKARALLGHGVVRRHMVTNLRFSRDAQGGLCGAGTFLFLKRPTEQNAQPVLELVGEWIDTYAQDAGGKWLFKTRKVVFLFPNDWYLPTPVLPR